MSHAPYGTKVVKVGQAGEAGTRFQSSGGLKQPISFEHCPDSTPQVISTALK